MDDAALNAIPLGNAINYKPGVRMVKLVSDAKVYVVAQGGILRWVTTEAIAAQLYGPDWNMKIDDIPEEFFAAYLIGPPITEAELP